MLRKMDQWQKCAFQFELLNIYFSKKKLLWLFHFVQWIAFHFVLLLFCIELNNCTCFGAIENCIVVCFVKYVVGISVHFDSNFLLFLFKLHFNISILDRLERVFGYSYYYYFKTIDLLFIWICIRGNCIVMPNHATWLLFFFGTKLLFLIDFWTQFQILETLIEFFARSSFSCWNSLINISLLFNSSEI